MKTYQEVLDEMRESVNASKNGKPKKTWSRSDFDRLLSAAVNEADMKMVVAQTKNGEMTEKEVFPTQLYRQALRKILIDFGVDKQAAEPMVNGSYKITSVDGMYELFCNVMFDYMNAGKKFELPTRKNFSGSMSTKTVNKATKEFSAIPKPGEPNPPKKFTVETAEHIELEKKSKAPKWLKKRFK